jgi:hypothetical protein
MKSEIDNIVEYAKSVQREDQKGFSNDFILAIRDLSGSF